MIAHLIVSTVVLALALVAASLPRLSARTRFAVLMLGLAKLLIPSLPKQAAAVALPTFEITAPAIVAAAAPASTPLPWLEIAWIAVAAILILRTLILTGRTNEAALRSATPPSPREIEALRLARERTGVRTSIDLIRSSICEAPAVVRVLRPVIVLPGRGTDALTDDELVSLLCHECAHVARRDNLLGVAEAIVRSLFWFHPLVWLAHSRIAVEREKACDEIAAGTHESAGIYANALTKVCRSLVAPPIAGVSCIASTNLKSRLESIMRYPSLRPVSHRAVATAAVLVVMLSTLAFAGPAVPASPYVIGADVNRLDDGTFSVNARIIDKKSGQPLAEPRVVVRPNVPATVTTENGPSRIVVRVVVGGDGNGTLSFDAFENGAPRASFTQIIGVGAQVQSFNGEPISLRLKDADLRDVLRTFEQITGIDFVIAEGIEGKVSMDVKDRPWDEVLHRVLAEQGLQHRIEGKKIYITR